MKANIGNFDRTLRLILGLAIIALGLYYESWWGAVGFIVLITSLIGFCPLYRPFGFSTCKNKSTTA